MADQGGTGAAPAGASNGMANAKLAAALAYLWITAIVFLLIEPYNKDKFVRFHSFQSLFLGLASIVLHIGLAMIPILGWIVLPFVSLAIFVLAVIGAVKAWNGQQWKIPVIGDMAEKQANA